MTVEVRASRTHCICSPALAALQTFLHEEGGVDDLTEIWARIASRTQEAATTGIKVCLCGPDDDCATSCRESAYRWKIREHWSGEIATFKAAGFDAIVRDWDGDYSSWVVKFRGQEIGGGDCHGGDDFRDGIICAEIVIRWNARKLCRRIVRRSSAEKISG